MAKGKDTKNLEAIIESIEMTPDQQEAFDTYIGEFLNDWKTKINRVRRIVQNNANYHVSVYDWWVFHFCFSII